MVLTFIGCSAVCKSRGHGGMRLGLVWIRGHGGMGLGLVWIRCPCRRHHGRVILEAIENRGEQRRRERRRDEER